ncbi:MAG: neutral/alkaline non-lysosomal ceramidase N-terminal domain-containing protein [Acidobacteriota bacterium]|nr:MAG: neutral/alkaline non-lysosomal ceramidase N-terminal domain-containing protein [Acidobacteriota bacterium]
MSRLLSLLTIMLLAGVPANPQTARFSAGVSQVDITPPAGVELWGYSNRGGPAVSTLDPLYARILVIDDGRTAVAVVTLDLGRTFGRAQIERIRERVSRDYHVNEVMLIASHTHSGPAIEDGYDGGVLPEWEARALDLISKAIGDARARMVPARIGAGMGQAIIGHNRRLVRSDGSVKMLWRNSTGQQTGMIDPVVGVIRIDDSRGVPLGILVNYACHPVVFGPDNLRYSADFPGAMAKAVKESFDSRPVTFFIQGAPGDINPLLDKTPLPENADDIKNVVGRTLGREVVRVAKSITTETPSTPEIAFLSEEMTFKNRWDVEKVRSQLSTAFGPRLAARYRRYITETIVAPVTTLVINRQIAIVGLPGEPFVGLQLLLKQRSPLPATFMAGYANGYFGYFPTIRDAASGGYGASTIVTRVEVGAGERMVDRGLIHIYRILGKLKDKPEDGK